MTQPRVLFIDDLEAVSRAGMDVQLKDVSFKWDLLHPETVEQEDVDRADVIIVDYFLDDWPERDAVLSTGRAPRDGLAVAASLRSSQLPSLRDRDGFAPHSRPTAFALWSANLGQATFELPEYVLPHVFARENNLEWVFKRNDLLTPEGIVRIEALANAVAMLSDIQWGTARPRDVLWDLLSLPSDVSWSDVAFEDAIDCRPPLHELGPRTQGMSLLRWLLHRIFPYPCFLMSESDLRARLRVDELWADESDSDLLRELEPFAYRGVLAGFEGTLWWRAGIEDWLWERTHGVNSSRDIARLAQSLGAHAEREWRHPVVVVDESLARHPYLVEIADTVRVRPDDWPVYADDAYARRDVVAASSGLQEIVHDDDRRLTKEA